MIRILGTADCSFEFPAELPLAYAYYGDVARVLNYLPHVLLVRAYGPDRFRLLYHSVELGVYQIRIYADVQTLLQEGRVIHIFPLPGVVPVRPEAWLRGAEAQGIFAMRSEFHDEGASTRIGFRLQLSADVPRPAGLRLMPGHVIDRLARSITGMRLREVVDGFVERSVLAFPDWLAEMDSS